VWNGSALVSFFFQRRGGVTSLQIKASPECPPLTSRLLRTLTLLYVACGWSAGGPVQPPSCRLRVKL